VTITRYHVEYVRTDGRNTPGVDVPYAFDGATTGTIPINGNITLGFELVRSISKEEAPLVALRTSSAVLSPDAKTRLDDIAKKALAAKGYVIEVTGFADSTGNTARNRVLSQHRADAVIRYLVETHQIPLRRIVTPFGFGEANPVADNATREGRAENRRVEVKVLVNKGLNQPAPTMNPGSGQ